MLKALGIQRQYISLLLLRLPFEAVRNLINALFLKLSFEAIQNLDNRRLCFVCAGFLVANIFLFSYNGTVWRFFGAFYARLQKKLKLFIIKKLLDKPVEETDALAGGDVLTRLNRDTQMTAGIYAEPWNLVFLVNGIANFILSSLLFCLFEAKLFLITFAFILPHVLISSYVFAPVLYSLQNQIQKTSAELTDMYASYINMADTVYLYDCSDFFLQKIRDKNLELRRLEIKKALFKALESASIPLFGLTGYLVLMFMGADRISAGLITTGSLLYAFQLRLGVISASTMIIKSITTISVNKAGLKRIKELTGMNDSLVTAKRCLRHSL